jgi:lipopolysaccharide transport system permease protein
MRAYAAGIWSSRHFWWHLACSDLRSRWRRSFLGILWSVLQPLGMAALLAVVFSRLFNTDISGYAPYILSGIIVWDYIMGCAVGGSLSFVQADAYIKQCHHPLAIYTLRTVLGNLVVLICASIPLFVWAACIHPEHVGLSWLAALGIYPAVLLVAWPLATILAYLATRFRDLPHALTLILQAVWFVSPIYFEERLFRAGGLDALVDLNPLYHLLQLARAPLLQGAWPTWENHAYVILFALILGAVAVLIGSHSEKRVIFYL